MENRVFGIQKKIWRTFRNSKAKVNEIVRINAIKNNHWENTSQTCIKNTNSHQEA